LRDLPRFPLIIPSRPNAIRTLVETRLAAFGLKPQVAMEIDAVPAILELVAEGHGYAVLSPRALRRTDPGPALNSRPIVQPRLTSTLAIATSAQRPITPIQQATIALIEELADAVLAPAAIVAPRGTLSRSRHRPRTRDVISRRRIDAMTQRTTPPFRADHVGSFLRPKYLLDARERKARGEITPQELRAVEDRAIAEVIKMQEDIGLQSITDGEFRRTYFHIDFLEQLGGVKTEPPVTIKKPDAPRSSCRRSCAWSTRSGTSRTSSVPTSITSRA
jgi:hypothetical protein